MAASGALMEAGKQMGQQIGGSLPSFAQYFFGNSGAPYDKARQGYDPHYKQGREAQNPFYNAGKNAIGDYQDWANRMKDPSSFINQLMGGYNESPWAKQAQQASRRAGLNAASAGGMVGSTPYLQQSQQNAFNISSQDMQNWLKNVLGINTEYGNAENNLYQGGQHAADQITGLEQNAGNFYAGANYGQEAGKQYDRSALWNGIGKFIGG